MPCRDYDTDNWSFNQAFSNRTAADVEDLKARADMLARIACKAMDELESNGIVEAILLRDDEVRNWYIAHKEADRIEAERIAAKKEKARLRKEALAKLTDAEKKLLGIKI